MKASALHKTLLGADFTVRYALTSARNGELDHTGAPQRFAVISILDGNIAWRTATDNGTLDGGATLLLHPHESATLTRQKRAQDKSQKIELIVVLIEPVLLLDAALRHKFIGREAEINFRAPAALQDARINRFACDLRDELTDERRGRDSVVRAIVEQLTIHLLRQHAVFRHDSALELSRVGLVDRRIRRAIELMHARMERDLPLEELAAAAYLSPFHFARLFKKLTGATPHAYLAAIRTTEAERLLATTDLSVTEISQQVGHASSSHFAKSFRAATGLSPRAFRDAVVRCSERD
jgi:AraC family transcriptional regulator